MDAYETVIASELSVWTKRMESRPTLINWAAKKLQVKINSWIPEKIHLALTTAIKQMTRTVCFGAGFITSKPVVGLPFQEIETAADKKILNYARTASAEGAITGAGGILLGLADFPLWLTVKMKMLFDLAALYGYDVKNYKERIYLLHIFELTFSSQANRRETFKVLKNWEKYAETLPNDMNQFDWRNFQQEYRDYIDIAKLLQLVPGIGAPIGAIVNFRLTRKLGNMAKNAFRMRRIHSSLSLLESPTAQLLKS
ncbi:MAG: EcsC family protein [Chryseolinea sp.]